jgi:Flp pilus assembly protein TadG
VKKRRLSKCCQGTDRGSTAVEFALLLPILLLMVFGLIDFGRALNAQITLTQAAREGARVAALGQQNSVVASRVSQAGTGLGALTVTMCGSTVTSGTTQSCCPANGPQGADATVQVTYRFPFVTPIGAMVGLGSGLTLTAQGVMPCEI